MLIWKTLAVAALLAPFVPLAPLQAQRCRNCVAEDTLPRAYVSPGYGLRVGAPQKASVALGVLLGEEWQSDGHDHSRNIALFAEPGLAAGRASLAYIDHGYGSFGSGFGVAATVMRTWSDPWWAKQNITYAGGEVILWPIVLLGPRIGVFRAMGASGAGLAKRWLVTVDFGFGL